MSDEQERTDIAKPVEFVSVEAFREGGAIAIDEEHESPEDRIMAMILNATSIDEIDTAGETVALKDFVGHPFTIQKVEWLNSTKDFADALPFFALIHAIDAWNEQPIVLNTGAKKACAQLFQYERLGAFPLKVQVEATPVGDTGNTVIKLKLVKN